MSLSALEIDEINKKAKPLTKEEQKIHDENVIEEYIG